MGFLDQLRIEGDHLARLAAGIEFAAGPNGEASHRDQPPKLAVHLQQREVLGRGGQIGS